MRPPAPSAPSTPAGRAVTPSLIEWTWTPPTGQSVIDTEVQYRASGASWPDIAYVGLTTPEIQQPDTMIGSTFQARARARAAEGASPWSATGSFVGAMGMSRVYVANASYAGQHPGVRPVRQPPNLRRIHRRYHVAARVGGYRNPRVRRQCRWAARASWCTTSPATAKRPKNSPSLPRSRKGWRLPQPVCTSPTPLGRTASWCTTCPATAKRPRNSPSLPRSRNGLAVTATRVYVANAAGTQSILVYDLSGNRQTSEEFTVATTAAARVGGYRNPRVRRQLTLRPDSVLVYDLSGNRQTSEEFTVATTQPQGLAVRLV